VRPVETLVEGATTKLEDLALVCANCHRMIHSRRPWLSVSAVRELLNIATSRSSPNSATEESRNARPDQPSRAARIEEPTNPEELQ
jgi:hypothetical protein